MKIAFDLDDVLTSFNLIWHKWHNKHYGSHVKFKDINSYYISQVFNITQKESNDRIFEFYRTKECADLPVEKGAKKVLEELKKRGHELYIITSRADEIEDMTRTWIDKNLPGVFKEIIEDAPHFVEEVANQGIKVAYVEKSWNKNINFKNDNIIRVKKLSEIIKYTDSLKNEKE